MVHKSQIGTLHQARLVNSNNSGILPLLIEKSTVQDVKQIGGVDSKAFTTSHQIARD